MPRRDQIDLLGLTALEAAKSFEIIAQQCADGNVPPVKALVSLKENLDSFFRDAQRLAEEY